MKPIFLHIAGLQSYREPQEIDFTKLCDAGVFGIFGPTGSGKSTILDAMTLALFGSVERAAGGTQGIMNQAENTLTVSFTFELKNAEGSQTYRIDRQFKRSGDVSVTNTVSRLIHLRNGESVVLADKAKDVSSRVQDILGLSMQDFTRAVVLPQGKFAEFLTLTGKDRRLMLQRLFHLESYGDQLSAKVSGRHKETEIAIKEIAAEQQGLGDASAEALRAAEERWREADLRAQQARRELAACQSRFEETRQLMAWQEDLATTGERLKEQNAKTPAVEELKRRLGLAEQAERLRPYLEQWEYAVQQVAQKQDAERTAEEEHAFARNGYAQAEAAQREAEQALHAQEAPLSVRLNQLQQALQLEQEVKALRQECLDRSKEAAASEAELRSAKEQMLKETELYEKAVQRQSELKEELKSVEVSAELRQKLQAASQERRELLQLQNRLSEQEEELARHKGRLAESEQLEQELMYKRKAWEERLREWLSSCRAAYLVTSRLVQELERLLQTVPQLAERIREAGREAELRRMAADLARGLKRGEPCPVCGSRVHAGAVLHAEDDEADGGLERLRELDALQADARKRLAYVQQLRFMLHGLLRQALSGEADVADGGIVYGETAAASETANTAGIDGIRQQLQTAAEAGNRLAAQAAELEHALTDLLRESLTLDGQQREIRSAAQQLIHFIEGLEQKRLSLSKSLAERFEAWEQEFPGLRRDEVQQKLEELRLKDEKADELRQRIDKSVPFIDERLAAMERLRRRIAALELAVVEQRTKLAGDDMRLREKERQLADLTGGQSAEALIAAATRQLSELRAAADAAKAKLEQARERLQAAVGRLAAARQAHASAAQHAAKAEEEWLRALAAAPFADGKQVRDALLPEEVKAAWAREAEAHDSELAQLRNKLQELERQLQGRTVSVDEWEALKAQFEQLKLEDERALQNKAKAERDVEELNIKHGHWKELEERRMEKQTMLERLSKLQSVLRGNAFVEFIAEEQLMQVCRAASERLGALTRGKYAIEVDSGGGFVIRDNAGGGIRRPVTTLSGGEMFLTSLSLALALSAQIQLKGQYPLEFFFLDEGFGTLDQELLETVIAALEKLHMDNLTVGVISHVPELKNRLPRRLIVDPPEPGGRGSRVRIETF